MRQSLGSGKYWAEYVHLCRVRCPCPGVRSFNGQSQRHHLDRVNMNIAVVGNIDQFDDELALKDSEASTA